MEDFVAYPSRWRLTLLILAAAAFVAAGLWMGGAFGAIPESRRYSASITFLVGWFSVIFFGLCAILVIVKLFDTREQVRIGPTGIRPSRQYDETVPWSEIADVTTWRYRNQKMIILHLRDPNLFPPRRMPAFVARANRRLTGGDIAINLTGTDRTLDETMAAIVRFRS